MNILDFPLDFTPITVSELLERRRKTFSDFSKIEKEHGGFLEPDLSLMTRQGQEALRVLIFRTFEEVLEGIDAEDPVHYSEELIDAVNYLLSIPLLDKKLEAPVMAALEEAIKTKKGVSLPKETLLGIFAVHMIDTREFLPKLRSRLWEHTVTSIYPDFFPELTKWIVEVFVTLVASIDTTCFAPESRWNQFSALYRAKDDVLQFRIQSKY